MENFGTALVGGLSGLQAALSGATGAAATGNVSMGNVAMDQARLAPNRTSAFMGSLQEDISGNTLTSNALSGRSARSLLRNEASASRVVSMRVYEQDATEASHMVDSASRTSPLLTKARRIRCNAMRVSGLPGTSLRHSGNQVPSPEEERRNVHAQAASVPRPDRERDCFLSALWKLRS